MTRSAPPVSPAQPTDPTATQPPPEAAAETVAEALGKIAGDAPLLLQWLQALAEELQVEGDGARQGSRRDVAALRDHLAPGEDSAQESTRAAEAPALPAPAAVEFGYTGFARPDFSLADPFGDTPALSGSVAALRNAANNATSFEYAVYTLPSDTLFPNQWHLNNTGQSGGLAGVDLNVEAVWNDYDGSGVTVGVWDDGVQYTHHDLDDNYNTGLHQIINGLLHDPAPQDPGSAHGTAVAGVIAAENNGTGTVGVAHGATLGAVDIFYDPAVPIEAAMAVLKAFDITNHSWGFTTPFAANILNPDPFWATFFNGLLDSTASGRGGLGTINMVAVGNDRTSGRDANDDNFNNIPQTIGIGAIGHDGFVSWYSTPGAAVLVGSPSNGPTGSGIWTTDRTGADGYSNGANQAGNTEADYTNSFGGTSSATPAAAGVVALMLEANPNLGWRDVQDILAASARHTGSDFGAGPAGTELYTWAFNGSNTWNGGGMHFSNDYGYGLIDAFGAVRLAETWTEQDTNANWLTPVVDTLTPNLLVPDNDPTGISFSFTSTTDMSLEHVGLTLTFSGTEWTGGYRITLISPDGTESELSRPQNNGNSATGSFFFMSNSFRGETSVGSWTVEISDEWSGFTSTVTEAELQFFGNAASSDDLYIFTEEFSDLAGGAHGHSTSIIDTNGGTDTINTSPIAGAVTLNLGAGTGVIDGVTLTGLSGIDQIFSGDGNDDLRGDSGNNLLDAGRGHDFLSGLGGKDLLRGQKGNDTLLGGGGADTLLGGAGNDRLVGGGRDDRLEGHNGKDKLLGANGNDLLIGGNADDNLNGGNGNDTLDGGAGRDILIGGGADDVFVYDDISDSTVTVAGRDKVVDFGNGTDIFDLTGIDANTLIGGNQAFAFIGTGAYSGAAGELRYTQSASNTILRGDVDGDGVDDFRVQIVGVHTLAAGDFML